MSERSLHMDHFDQPPDGIGAMTTPDLSATSVFLDFDGTNFRC